jgi:hypothetical protein
VRASLTGVDIFNTIMMQRSLDKRLIVLVESPEDSGIIDPHLNEVDIQTFPGFGKESVLMAAELFLNFQMSEIVAVVDCDLDRYTGRDKTHPANVVMTEFYDLDADVLFHCPQALDAILANFTDRPSREAYLAARGVSAYDIIWEMAIAVGEIRYWSIIRQMGLNLRGFPIHEVIDGYEQGVVRASVLALTLARTAGGVQIKVADIETLAATIPDKRYIASGHDLASAVAAFIRTRWGGRVGETVLSSALRSAIQCQCWQRTIVHKFVQEWAGQFSVNAWTCP